MANPFGAVVDNYHLDLHSDYVNRKKTQEDRARVAMTFKNENGKNAQAEEYVRRLKDVWGSGRSPHCLVYNGTGHTLKLVNFVEREGFIGRTPYPLVIGNGQWVSFLHVQSSSGGQTGAIAALVYRGKNASGQERDFYFSWRVPNTTFGSQRNSALCEVGRVDSFQGRYSELFRILSGNPSKHSVNRDGMRAEVDIGTGTAPFFRAILYTPFGPLRP